MKKISLKIILLLLVVLYSISVPIYGQAYELQKQGNFKGFEDEIRCIKDDFCFLETEITKLVAECNYD